MTDENSKPVRRLIRRVVTESPVAESRAERAADTRHGETERDGGARNKRGPRNEGRATREERFPREAGRDTRRPKQGERNGTAPRRSEQDASSASGKGAGGWKKSAPARSGRGEDPQGAASRGETAQRGQGGWQKSAQGRPKPTESHYGEPHRGEQASPPSTDQAEGRRTAAGWSRAAGGGEAAQRGLGGWQFFSPVPRGLEEALAEELATLGAQEIHSVPGGVAFQGNRETCYRVNLNSRLATRVLRRVAGGSYAGEADIYQLVSDVDWQLYFSADCSIRIYVTAIRARLKSLEFITLKAKDALVDRFRADCGRRPSVNTAHPDVRIHLFLTADQATIYIDTTGEPLWLRGQKIAKVEAPIKENLAAGILRLTGWQPGMPLLDPMCGSGTFLLEAAQQSLGEAPGLLRDPGNFGFERLHGFDAALWRRLQEEAAESRRNADTLPLWGSDINPDAVARAAQNLAFAGLDDLVRLNVADVLTLEAPAPSGVLVANLPYGERLGDVEELATFYPKLGDALKQHFSGWTCWLLSADEQLPKLIGLKASRRIPLYNGPLECRLYRYDIVTGSARKQKSIEEH